MMFRQAVQILDATLRVRRRSWVSDVCIGLAVAMAVMAMSCMMATKLFERYEPPHTSLTSWTRSKLVVDGNAYIVVRRALLLGDMYAVIDASAELPDFIAGDVHGGIGFVDGTPTHSSPVPTHIVIDHRIHDEALRWGQRAAITPYVSGALRYHEVLVARAPFAVASAGVGATLSEASKRVIIGSVRGAAFTPRNPPISVYLPSLLLGSIPARPEFIGCVLNIGFWVVAVMLFRHGVACVRCSFRRARRRCMICAYPMDDFATCPECGTSSRR